MKKNKAVIKIWKSKEIGGLMMYPIGNLKQNGSNNSSDNQTTQTPEKD